MAFPLHSATGVMRSPLGSINVPEARGLQDYFGLNYYTRDYVTFDLRKIRTTFAHNFYSKDADLSDNKFLANEPDGMFEALKWAYEHLSQPAHPHYREWHGRCR